MQTPKRLYRSETDQIIGGVASGLGDYFDLDPSLVRVMFLVLTFAGGSGLLLYFALWLVLPRESKVKQGAASKETLEDNAREMETKAKETITRLQQDTNSQAAEKRKQWLGIGLLVVGTLIFLSNLNIIDFDLVWPLTLIFIGAAILFRK